MTTDSLKYRLDNSFYCTVIDQGWLDLLHRHISSQSTSTTQQQANWIIKMIFKWVGSRFEFVINKRKKINWEEWWYRKNYYTVEPVYNKIIWFPKWFYEYVCELLFCWRYFFAYWQCMHLPHIQVCRLKWNVFVCCVLINQYHFGMFTIIWIIL